MEQSSKLDFNEIVLQYKDLVESMAFVAFQKMRKPSPLSIEDLHQEGYIVCVEWVSRWFDPDRGASLKTFITGGLRNHFADLVKASYRDSSVSSYEDGGDEESTFLTDPQFDARNTDLDPVHMASFNETLGRFSEKELQYITTVLTPKQEGKLPTRADVRKALGLTEDAEMKIRNSIEEKLRKQVHQV